MNTSRYLSIGSALAAACLTFTAHGQSGSPALEEIIVTATKRDERLQDVPVAITALTAQQVEKLGVQRVADYIALVPGFAVRDHGAPGHGTVILRGLNTGTFQSTATTAYYFDDTPFTPSGALSYGAFVTPDPDISDIERIEVLKGPQGTLYGASSLGGVVRLISKKPDLNEVGGSIKLDGSSVHGGNEGYGVRGVLNVPLIDETLAVRLSGVARHIPGYVDNVFTGKKDRNEGHTYGGRIAVLWQASQDLSVELAGLYQKTETDALHFTFANTDTDKPKFGRNKDYSAVDDGITPEYETLSAKAEYSVGPGTLVATGSFAKYDVDTFFDFTDAYGYPLTLPPPFGLGLPPGSFATPTYGNSNMKKYTEEVRYVSERLGRFEFLVGAYHTYEKTEFAATVPVKSLPGLQQFPAPFDVLVDGLTFGDYEETAGFGNLTYYITDNVDITAGVRYSHNKQEYAFTDGISFFTPEPAREIPKVSDSAETYLVTLRWRPTEHINTYLRAASGYRPGGPGVSRDPTAPTEFDADTVWNYEAGIKASTADYALSMNLAVFHIDWKDLHMDRYDANGLPFTVNGGKAEVDGVEIDLAARPFNGVTVGFNAGYTDAEIKEADPRVTVSTGASAGEALPLSSKYTAALLGDYSFDIGAQTKGSFGATYKYQGKKHSSYPGSPSDPDVVIPSYQVVDLRAGFNIGHMDVQLRCDNVFDEGGISTISSFKILNNPASPTFLTYIRPRTFSISLGMSF